MEVMMKHWLFKNSPLKSFVMGIINPLDIVPYFRVYDVMSKTVYDIPCHARETEILYSRSKSLVQIQGYGAIFPRYENGSWNTDGYYVLEVYDNNAAFLVDLNGNTFSVREYDLRNLIRQGKIINCYRSETGYWDKKRYAVLKFDKNYWVLSGTSSVWHELCRTEDVKRVNDLIIMRAKLTNIGIDSLKCEPWCFGMREIDYSPDVVGDTLVFPMGITGVNAWFYAKPNIRHIICPTPYFSFNGNAGMRLDSLTIPSAHEVTIRDTTVPVDSYIGNLTLKGDKISVSDSATRFDRVRIWGTRTANLYLTRPNAVPECLLYNVIIHCDEAIVQELREKCILCNCQIWCSSLSNDLALTNMRQVTEQEMRQVTEQEMRALWGDAYVDSPRLIV